MKKRKYQIQRKGNVMKTGIVGIGIMLFLGAGFAVVRHQFRTDFVRENPGKVLKEYMSCIKEKDYEKMYRMIAPEVSGNIEKEDFISRNANIYEGIEIQDMQIHVKEVQEEENAVLYTSSFSTVAGTISFSNTAYFEKDRDGYRLIWDDSLIFPELEAADKVRVSTVKAVRGRILDREEHVMARQGIATSVGLVPMRMDEQTVEKLAVLLDISKETIEGKLSVSWVKEDSFVPIVTIPKIEELKLLALNPDSGLVEEFNRQKEILEIPGVMFQDVEVREYPYKEAAAHLIGYVQSVTAEDLKEHAGEGYRADSVIGRSGIEGLYEKKLKGTDGSEVYIVDENGRKKAILAYRPVRDGQDIRLTIDAVLQESLYEQFKDDKGCSVAMNPCTGEVLALVSTPSYDSNLFVLGMSEEQWNVLNEDEKMPLYNRFRQVWCPGSTFKPVIASIGLRTAAIDPTADYGNEGQRWQKDRTWGEYFVTTLHAYEPVILENAMMYSDNIYFAKAALRIGTEELVHGLKELGLGKKIPFEIVMSVSQYSNTETIDSEIQLADSGYGQGEILMNPLHLAALYTMFCNRGDVLQPRLLYQEEAQAEVWLSRAFPEQIIEEVKKGMDMVINHPEGTGYGAHREGRHLIGKTGTAEIKAAQDDANGTELGWFAVFTADSETEKPILLVSMVEDVKEIGGSGYVVEKDVKVLDMY